MYWIKQFQLFLFDFDGLLVNTEQLHFAAYVKMCQARGFNLKWDFRQFCLAAHFHSTGLRDAIYTEFPELYIQQPCWEVLYAEKKRAYLESLNNGQLQLMPGVDRLLYELDRMQIKRCVATHSPKEQIEIIKANLPDLQSIPKWITREDYQNPKPAPDAYLCAIEKMGGSGCNIIGFEDSVRGLSALKAAQVHAPVLICSKDHPQLEGEGPKHAFHFESLEEIPVDFDFDSTFLKLNPR